MSANKPPFDGEWVKLGDVCKVVGGSTPKTDDPGNWGGDIKWVTPAEIRESVDLVTDTLKHVTPQGVRAARLRIMPAGTVLLTTRAPIGKVALAGDEMCCNQGFKCLICSSEISNEWLLRLLRYKSCELQQMGTGATFRELSKKVVSSYRVKLPAMASQLLTVERLSSLEKLLGVLRRQLVLLDQLVKSRFVEMFGGMKYKSVPMGHLVAEIVAGTNVGGKQRPLLKGEYGVLKISAVTKGVFDASQYKVVEDVSSIKMVHPRKGDLLFSRANTSEMVGATAIVDKDCACLFLPDKLWRIDPTDEVNTVFLKALLSSSRMRREISNASTGSSGSMQNISMTKFRSLPAFLPPLAFQQEFAAFVAEVDKSRFIVQQKIEKLQMLYDSLAQEYFG